ncbi:MAG: IS3 family transposase [bacterium]
MTRSALSRMWLIRQLGISRSRFYEWAKRIGKPNQHNGALPKSHWLFPEERQAIIDYCRPRLEEGYRRLTYMMLDDDVVAVSPAATYRVLKAADLLNRWQAPAKARKQGFEHPLQVHEHWHTDICYVNILGTIYFLICVLDGTSRYIVEHDLRLNMTEWDVEIVLQRAHEKYPDARPRIISDNGPQFISKDFREFIRLSGFTHVKTAPYHPQSNGKLERFHGTIKQEEIRKNSYLSLQEARKHIARFIGHYNTTRLHSAIHYLTPEDVLMGRVKHRLDERQKKLDAARAKRLQRTQVPTFRDTSSPCSVLATSMRNEPQISGKTDPDTPGEPKESLYFGRSAAYISRSTEEGS